MMIVQEIASRTVHAVFRYGADRRGAATLEFALTLILFVIPIANIVDLGAYVYQRMELENATQSAAQTAWAVCSTAANLPATPNSYANCSALPAAITTAVHGTSLGSSVSATTTEGYYCVNTTTNSLVSVGTFPGTKPANCSSVGSASDTVGDYIKITASYTYSPLFTAVSVTSLLATPITRTAWMRLG